MTFRTTARLVLPAVLCSLAASTTRSVAAPSLGGPIEQPARVQFVGTGSTGGSTPASTSAVERTTPAATPATKSPGNTRVAQSERPMGGADESPGGSGQAVVQEPLPIDAALIRRLRVAGRNIDEAPRRVGNVEILAPMVAELSGLGASATRVAPENVPGNINTPSEDQIFQINLPQGAPIVLIVGREVAYINRVEQPLRAAPLVIKGKIWLPVFSLAPLLGAAPRMQSDGTLHLNPTVQSVELFPVKGVLALTIKTSAPLAANTVQMGTLENPPKLYLDFPGFSMGFDAASSQGERTVSNGMNEVQKVRAGLFQDFPDTTRIVLDLKTRLTAVRQTMPDPTLFALVLGDPNRPTVHVVAPPSATGGSLRGITIVVDAGHGGYDHGALGSKSREKDQTLDIARKLRDLLVERGATVHMTRDGDYFISLQGRVDFAHSRGADIFFSVHINSFRSTSSGTETFYWSAQSQSLAREVQKELVKATGLPSRGVSQARFYVIRKTRMPSVLTDTAFISNPKEEKLLTDPEWRTGVARHMAQGINNYVDKYMRRSGM
jgi:N-acetylmuramoyl-L-alanine amidase